MLKKDYYGTEMYPVFITPSLNYVLTTRSTAASAKADDQHLFRI